MVGACFLFAFLDGVPGLLSFILIPISLISLLLAAAALIVAACVFVARRRLHKATSFALALLAPIMFRTPIRRAADCLHLALMLEFGFGVLNSEQVRSGALIDFIPLHAMNGKFFAAFDWSAGLAGGPSTFLIRDPTDEVVRPVSQHRHPNLDKTGFEEACSGKSEHLFGHYYTCAVD